MAKRLTSYIFAAILAGALCGSLLHVFVTDPVTLERLASILTTVTDVFLRLIKMVIAPLIFATLVTGIARMNDVGLLGRIGLRALVWFLSASLVSLALGLLLGNLFRPGEGLDLAAPAAGAVSGIDGGAVDLQRFITHAVPQSVIQAMAANAVLPIVVFSVFLGVALAAMQDQAAPLVRALDLLTEAMMKVTGYVMRLAPFAVFSALAHAVAINGLSVLISFGKLVATFYLGIAALLAILVLVAMTIIGKSVFALLREIRQPILLGFSTSSSEITFPGMLDGLERFGVRRSLASFILPLGYSFNLDGSMMFMTLATLFIAQAYGISLDFGTQLLLVAVLMLSSKGMASVPRASLVVVAGVLPQFGLPSEGLLLVMAIDQILDMGRTATNVVGNALATAAIARWEVAAEAADTAQVKELETI
ncbi:dicarboxylate/amino acid:cation symporter [Novosphingobium sp. BW1]|uniref:dicarboxylate/amino acid:cation symporter n=1 Tax=Novosphingobium sp. BW1 TaxID=2592621 RepID=UPI0011DEB157|nr:dicarboxylate/amino acid:cation symporter [Novosphingobium sp. BW1]TYC94413.1 dicarboxylate/amino acid:cation symporter [Novosphingobium sp. BW1]